jgi:tetratricopeptide (TPR) repeat protein
MRPLPLSAVPAALALVVCAVPLAAQNAAESTARAMAADIHSGDSARCRRNSEAALERYRAALALDSLNYEANWKAARELTDIGKLMPDSLKKRRDTVYAEALALAQRAVRADSMGADGHYMVAVAAGRVALTKSAHERVKSARVVRDAALRALALDSVHDGALHVMGRWNAEIMRLPGITKFFARTFLGASIFSEASWANANRYFHQAIRINPQNVYHHLDLAEALVDEDSLAEARTELRLVSELPLGCDAGDPTYKIDAAMLLAKISRH